MSYPSQFQFGFELGGFRIVARPTTRKEFEYYLRRLLAADWESPDSALQLADDLTLAEVGPSRFYDQTRLFLRLLVENQGALLTPSGWLKRAYVARMMEQMEWARRETERFRRFTKVFDEFNVRPLKVIRAVCELSGLVRRRKGRVFVPQPRLRLLEDAPAGTLFRQLFLTLFRKLNLAYLDWVEEASPVQETMAVIFWRLQTVAEDWTPLARMPDELLLLSVQRELERLDSLPNRAEYVVTQRVIEPLVWFGLLEYDRAVEDRFVLGGEVRVRKTPLFDRFIQFPPFPVPGPVEAS